MSLPLLNTNKFKYATVDPSQIFYRMDSNTFTTIDVTQGVLLCDHENKLSFGIPSAAQLVKNYTGNSIIMTQNNELVEVPVTGTSANKLLRYIDNSWQIVDFSLEYIAPDLYNPNSFQLWIADDTIKVINIPKANFIKAPYGVQYDQDTDEFTVFTPGQTFSTPKEIVIYLNNNSDFKTVYESAEIYSSTSSNDLDLYTCIYSSNASAMFDGKVSSLLKSYSNFTAAVINWMSKMWFWGGLYIKNATAYTSNAKFCIYMADDSMNGSVAIQSNTFCTLNLALLLANGKDYIFPYHFWVTKPSGLTSYPRVYVMILKSNENDTAEFYWYNPYPFMNIYVAN